MRTVFVIIVAGIQVLIASVGLAPEPMKLRTAISEKPLEVMPDLSGLTMRQVLTLLHRSGLRCRFEGIGLAGSQYPPPGTSITPGVTFSVKFAPTDPPQKKLIRELW